MPNDKTVVVTVDTLPSASMTLDQAMKLPRYARMWPSQAQQCAMRDLAMAKAGVSPDVQEARRDHFKETLSKAWQNP